jgi:FkbM family methyltransferase
LRLVWTYCVAQPRWLKHVAGVSYIDYVKFPITRGKVRKHIPLKFIDDDSEVYSYSEEILRTTETPVVLSIGIGHRTGFDEAMIGYYGAHVYGFDPTPTVVKYVDNAQATGQLSKSNFHFQPYAIGGSDCEATFHFPKDENNFNGSLSPEAADGESEAKQVQVRTIKTVMKENNLDNIDLIQMDIEGGEYDVIDALSKDPMPCKQLAIEFHFGLVDNGFAKTRRSLKQLSKLGYVLVDVRRSRGRYSEVLLVHKSAL